MRIGFGPFRFDPQSRLLWRDEAEIALPPRVLGVLELLLERSGQVVARQDLLDRVWKDSFVTDTSLAEAVSFLRQALGDDPQAPVYIQTVHRRGYRFLLSPHPEPDPGQTGVQPGPDWGRTVVEPGSDGGQTGVRPGSDGAQTRTRPGSDHLRRPFDAGNAGDASNGGHAGDAGGARVAVDAGHAGSDGAAAASARTDWQLVPWSVALLCGGLAIAAVWHGATTPRPAADPVVRFELHATSGTAFDPDPQAIAIAPDGRTLAWSACEIASGRCALYARPIDRADAQPIPGSDGGHSPVFSPDGRWIAYFADGALKKIATSGGAPSTLASAPAPAGLAWSADGRIAFAGSAAGGLSLVDEQGGKVQTLTTPRPDRGELRHRHPAWLDGRGLLFIAASTPDSSSPGELAAMARGTTDIRILRSGVQRALFAGGGYLLLATANDVQAMTFDPQALLLTGSSDAMPGMTPQFAASDSTLALVRASAPHERVWSDGAGASAIARMTSLAIAPDSRHVAGVIAEGSDADIWIADLASGAVTRLTFGGTNVSPAWSADGERVYFATRTGTGPYRVVSDTIDRGNTATALTGAPPQAFPTSAAADGRVAATIYNNGRTGVAILGANERAPRLLDDGPFDEANAVFSPDGRDLALESSASGRTEVVVRSLADGRRLQISRDGGTRPQWSEDGRMLYFFAGRRVMKVTFATRDVTAASPPEVVFDRADARPVAVTPSGRVLVDRQPASDTALAVLHWLSELRARLPLPVNAPR